jgi:hypothetical protein
MTQEEITKLLLCRAAIDKHRAFNQARVESLATAKSVTEAKALIESKTGVATTISADSAVKTTDDIKKILEIERTKSTLEMYDILKQQGFETYDDFHNWHDEIVYAAYQDYVADAGTGYCDFCGEKELKDQPCVKKFGVTGVCVAKITSITDAIVWDSFILHQEGNIKIVDGKEIAISRCPEGHGFHIDAKKVKTLPVDIKWRA